MVAHGATSVLSIQDPLVDETGKRASLSHWDGTQTVVSMEYSACKFVCSANWKRCMDFQGVRWWYCNETVTHDFPVMRLGASGERVSVMHTFDEPATSFFTEMRAIVPVHPGCWFHSTCCGHADGWRRRTARAVQRGHGTSDACSGLPMGAMAWPLRTAAMSSSLGYCPSSQ